MAAAGAPPSASPSALGRGPGKTSYTRPPEYGGERKAHTQVEAGWGRRGDAPSPSLRMQQQVAATWPVEAQRLQARVYGPGRGRSVRNVAVGAWGCVTHSHPRDVYLGTRGLGWRRSLLPLVSLTPSWTFCSCAVSSSWKPRMSGAVSL